MEKGSLVSVLISLALVGCTATEMFSATSPESGGQRASGHVYDIDYVKNKGWTQILIMPMGGERNPTLQTDNALVQAVLETALLDRLSTEVTYYESGSAGPAKILTATISAGPPTCPVKGCVERVTCVVDGECSARINGELQEAKTKEIRALGVLLTAINKKKAVENLVVDPKTYQIHQVKINAP